MKPKQQFTIASLLLVAVPLANAADYVSDLDYYQDFPVVLSASRLSQPLSEAPNAMTVIDRKMIVASGFRAIPDLFKLVPGMYVSYYKGSQAFVSYHGSPDQHARRMQVMIDGRSVYMPPVSAVDWATLPITIDDIERIEVIRGPAAASYGANSTQGVISITTRDAGGAEGKSVAVTHGSKGIKDVSARIGKRGEALDYRMTLAYSADNGYDALSTPPNNIPITQFQAPTLLNNSNDSNQTRLFNFRADYHPNGVDRFDIQFGFNHNIEGVGFSDRNSGTNTNPYHDLFINSGFLQLEWLHLLGNASELSTRYSRIRHDKHETLPYYLGGKFNPGPIGQSTRIDRDEIEIKHTLPLGAANRLVYGVAYQTEQVSGQGHAQSLALDYSSSFNAHEYRVFAHDEWRITPHFLLNTGGMFEQDNTGHQNFSPRVTLNFHATPRQTLRIGTSVAYRTPSLLESRYPLDRQPRILPGALFVPSQKVTSPGLLPEKLVSREIGYLGEFPDQGTSLDVRVFRDQVSNGIYVASTVNFVNGVSSTYQGMEATVKYAFNADSHLTVNLARELGRSNGPALAAAGQKYFRVVRPGFDDILSASIPKNSASVLYSQRLAHEVNLSAAYYYQGAMQPFDRGLIDYQPIQRRLDVRVAKGFHLDGGIKGDLALVVQNLLDTGYTEYIASNLFNRRGYATLTLKW